MIVALIREAVMLTLLNNTIHVHSPCAAAFLDAPHLLLGLG
jgi:hypothetical protein